MAENCIFNAGKREHNMLRASMAGVACYIAQLIPVFVGRTIFLRVLSSAYLGITGLFTNVLLILSLTDMGIATAITYRFYAPVSRQDVEQVGRLMNFFRKVYNWIICALILLGMLILPWVKLMVKDAGEIPADVNIYAAFLLFLADSISTYLFVYKQTMLSVDQRNDLISLFQTVCVYVSTAAKIALLLITHSYMLYLASGIIMTIAINYGISLWITRRYKPVFEVTEPLPKEEQAQIFRDTTVCLLHKTGHILLTGTDSLLLTKLIGLTATGLYSNYSIIITYLTAILSKVFGNFSSSIGNAKVELDRDTHFLMYRQLRFMNLFFTSAATICLYVLVGDFITIWLGPEFRLEKVTVICLCARFFINVGRVINTSYVEACGWFNKDKSRPFIAAALNLIFSVLLAKPYGFAGIFLGTVLAELVTVCWREPYLLYHFEFQHNQLDYWTEYIAFTVLTIVICIGFGDVKEVLGITVNSWIMWLAEAVIAAIVSVTVLSLVFLRKRGFRYMCRRLVAAAKRTFSR